MSGEEMGKFDFEAGRNAVVETSLGPAVAIKTHSWPDHANSCVRIQFVAYVATLPPLKLEYAISDRESLLARHETNRIRYQKVKLAIEEEIAKRPTPAPPEPVASCPFAVGDRVFHVTQIGTFTMAVVKAGPDKTECEWFGQDRIPCSCEFDNRVLVKRHDDTGAPAITIGGGK